MMAFTLEQQVNASVEDVFAAASDLPNAPHRIRGITKMEVLTEGPIGVGTRFRETRIMFKREATEEMEITSFDPPAGYTMECRSHGSHYVTRWSFHPEAGGTRIRMVFEARPLTFMAKVMGFIFKPLMKACMKETAKDLEDLKTSVEVERTAAGEDGRGDS